MIAKTPQPLLPFFEQHFMPEQLAGKTAWVRYNYMAAIHAFGRFLKREPMLDDLDADTFERFAVWLRRGQRYAPSTVRSRKGAIHAIWSAAYAVGLAGEPVRTHIRVQPWNHKRRNLVQFKPVPEVKREPPSGDSLLALVERYPVERDIGPGMLNQCRYTVNKFSQYLGRPAVLSDFSDSTANGFIVALQQQTKLAPVTIKSYRGNLLTLWRLAFECELLDHLPKRVRRVKVPRKLPEAWTLDELRILMAAAGQTAGRWPNGIPKGKFWVAFIACGFFTALRLGDLLRLEFEQIEPTGWLTMMQHKTDYPIRCYLPPDAMRAVQAIAKPKRKRVFPQTISTTQKAFGIVVTRAGLKGSTKTLRKAAATAAECARSGAATELLGHRDANLARRHYIDPTQVQGARPLLPRIQLGEPCETDNGR